MYSQQAMTHTHNIVIMLYLCKQTTNLSKYINPQQIVSRTVYSTPKVFYSCTASPPPFFSPSSGSSTHEKPFLISHTFEKCQKCFMRLVWAQLVQSDVRAGLIKAEGRGARGVQRGGAACRGAAARLGGWNLNQLLLPFRCRKCNRCLFSLRNQIAGVKSVIKERDRPSSSYVTAHEITEGTICRNT